MHPLSTSKLHQWRILFHSQTNSTTSRTISRLYRHVKPCIFHQNSLYSPDLFYFLNNWEPFFGLLALLNLKRSLSFGPHAFAKGWLRCVRANGLHCILPLWAACVRFHHAVIPNTVYCFRLGRDGLDNRESGYRKCRLYISRCDTVKSKHRF